MLSNADVDAFEQRFELVLPLPLREFLLTTTVAARSVCLSVTGATAGQVFYWDAHARPGTHSVHLLAEDLGSFISTLRSDALSPGALES